jgi:type IV pilus assembly protein PilB
VQRLIEQRLGQLDIPAHEVVRSQVGLTFAAALRAFLRQDPDIIMVGEIRDQETAQICLRAALTGHMVFSTLHTNDAPGAVTRLLNMGVEPFLITSTIIMVVAQRLIRKLCPDCKEAYEPTPEQVNSAKLKAELIYRANGCAKCNNTGYKGRVALYEVMPVREEIRELILHGASATEIKREAIRLGMKTLRQTALTKLKEGITTVEEVLKATVED